MKFYTGLPIVQPNELKGLHITTMFAPLVATGRMFAGSSRYFGKVIAVEYWPRCNKTVAIVECHGAVARFDYWKSQGFVYDYEYRPHITLGDMDNVEFYKALVGIGFETTPEYLKIKS